MPLGGGEADASGGGGLVPVAQLARAAVATYLGLEMLTHLDPERADPDALFDAAAPVAVMLDTLRPD